jgi:shikimate dehydrogenase
MAAPSVHPGTRRGAAVLGSPIAHSLSPVLHQAAYASAGLTGWTYDAVECDAASLGETLARLDAAGLAGVSLTMPLKRAVLPALSRVDRLAAEVGAVNTVLFGGLTGEWWGSNTDVPGIVDALSAASPDPLGLAGSGAPGGVVVLGAGATAASALASLSRLGARSVTVAARRPEAATDLERVAATFGIALSVTALSADPATPDRMVEADLVISTLPAGAAEPLADSLRGPAVRGLLFDVVYDGWPTVLAQAWAGRGGRVMGGLELLVRQAALQVQLMTGITPDVAAMRAAGEQALGSPPGAIR